MTVEVLADAAAVARRGANFIAAEAHAAVAARGQFTLAFSGGRTPWQMLRELTTLDVPWNSMYVFQVDERVAAANDPDRNIAKLIEILMAAGGVRPHIEPMPVEAADLDLAAVRYEGRLAEIAGAPPVLDLVHLGLGTDGHTASLVPGDRALEIVDADVTLTNVYQGRRRMTLTYPILNRARRILWVVTGEEKTRMLARLRHADQTIPAGRVRQDYARLIGDRAAAPYIRTETSAPP